MMCDKLHDLPTADVIKKELGYVVLDINIDANIE